MAQSKYGLSALRLAFQGERGEVVRLVERGVDPTGMNEQVAISWQVALHQEDVELARVLERDTDATA